MSYSSETEVSEENEIKKEKVDSKRMRKSVNMLQGSVKRKVNDEDWEYQTNIQQINEIKPEPPIYSAIVLDSNEASEINSNPAPRYFTRCSRNSRTNGIVKDEVKKLKKESEEEYEDYETESQDEYSEEGEDSDEVFVAHQVKAEKEKKMRNKKEKPFKRARKSALPWTSAESKTLAMLVNLYGAKEWQFVAKILQSKHNNNRSAAQCSQRWCRVINPSINKGPWDVREDKLLCEKI